MPSARWTFGPPDDRAHPHLLEAWKELTKDRAACLVEEPEWLRALSGIADRRAFVGAAWEADRLDLAAPFVVRKIELPILLASRPIFRAHLMIAALVSGDFISRGRSLASARELMDRMASELPEVDGWYFENVRAGSLLDDLLRRRLYPLGFFPFTEGRATLHHVAEWHDGFEAYAAAFRTRHKDEWKRMRRKRKQLEERGPIQLLRFHGPDEVDAFVGLASPVAERSWQGRALGRRFDEGLRALVHAFAKSGWLQGYVLQVHQTPVAFEIDLGHRDTVSSEIAAYDPQWAAYQPGKLLLWLAMEDLARQGYRAFDFGTGDHEYKRKFGTRAFRESSVYLLRDRPRTRLLASARRLARAATELGKATLERYDLVDAVRRWTRNL